MSDIPELENRITAALDRIAWSIENTPAQAAAAPAPVPAPAEPDADLVEELEIERTTNARLVATSEKNVARIERLETRVLRMTDRLEDAEAENKRLNAVIAAMSENNAALRNGDSGAADAGLAAELEHLKAARANDLAELDDIMAELAPIVKEG
ncbi:hypothetical protein [uncultured Litoreibacter sp.]|uniref:hypothetical protein n=1 Tax=uncultured Litoreibacter sp. TaxID=1392394 RepID=UPI002616F86D|nr:hypothetical protein [uncultured Litoreibacter sp.]